jgi:hypothetical protein
MQVSHWWEFLLVKDLMSKDTYYFQHDYHARKDPKCQALISEYGMSSYGIYWALMEIMHEQGGKIKKFPKLYDGLSFEFGIEKDVLSKQIEAMLHDFELLLQDDNYIWSDRVIKNLKEREAKKMLRVDAGKLGGIKSGISRLNRSKMKHCLKQNEANEPKERKGKEKKTYTDDFLAFYSAYPKHIGKEPAWRAWKKHNGNLPPLADMIYKVNELKNTEDWIKENGKYIPHPATWLNQKRWEDELTPTMEKETW